MKGSKHHKWIFWISVNLIKGYKGNKKLSVSGIRAKLDKTDLYDDIGRFEDREARINNILKWMSKHKKLLDIKSRKPFFNSKNDFPTIFNEKTANLRVFKFGKLWGLE